MAGKLRNPFLNAAAVPPNPFADGNSTVSGVLTDMVYRAVPMGRVLTDVDTGTAGMPDVAARWVRQAQSSGGDAAGDAARVAVQAPTHLTTGVAGGAMKANAGFNQMLHDFTPLGALPFVGDWLRSASDAGMVRGDELMQTGMQNYRTQTARDVAGGISSVGATAPLTAAAVATRNPKLMYFGAGAQTGLTEYADARRSGLGPLAALAYGGTQAAIETGTEMLPAGALVDMFKPRGAAGKMALAPVRYAVGEMAGEQLATLGQDYMRSVHIDARTNPNWWRDYQDNIPANAKSTAISSLVMGPGNVAVGSTAEMARRGYEKVQPHLRNPFAPAASAAPAVSAGSPPNPFVTQAVRKTQNSADATLATAAAVRRAADARMLGRTDIPTVAQATGQGVRYRPAQAKPLVPVRQNADAVRQTVNKIIGVESGGNPNAKNTESSATGLGQFISSTWLAMVRRHRPDVAAGKSDAQLLDLRRDAALSREMTTRYTEENAAALRKAGLPVTEGNLYLAHFSGVGTAIKALRANPNAPAASVYDPRAVNANKSVLQGKTVGQVVAWAQRKMGERPGAAAPEMAAGDMQAENVRRQFEPEWVPEDAGSDAQDDLQDAARAQRLAAEEMQDAARRSGRETRVYLDEQMRAARLRLMEADDLAPTMADAANQYRDRNRAASEMQVNQIANRLQPELLGDSMQADTGAPTLANDGQTIIGGNGRVLGINRAYENGNGEGYRQYLMDHAAQFGFDPGEVAAMKKPVLVRQLDESVDIARAAVASNEGGGLGMSALEQARVDAERLPDFGALHIGDDGNLNTAANRGFIRDFVRGMPVTVQAQMMDAGGNLSQEGYRRLNNAILHRAYGNSPALSRMVDSTDQGMRNLVNAMMQAAPKIAEAKEAMRGGHLHDADIAGDLVSAVEKINQLRDNGQSVADYLAQEGLFGEDLSPVARDLLAFLDEYKRSAKAVATLLRNYYDALSAQGSPNQGDVFGDAAAPDKQQLLERTIDEYRQEHGKPSTGNSLFNDADGRAGLADQQAEPQPAGGRGDAAGAGEDAGGAGGRSDRGLSFSRSESTRVQYEQRIDELFAGAKANLHGAIVLDRSDLLDMLGYGDMPVQLDEAKVLLNQKNHPEMTADAWKRVPEWLDNPAAVLKSRTHDKRLVFVPEEMMNGAPVYVIVEPDTKGLRVHALVNAYAKDGNPAQAMRDIERDLRNGHVDYVNKEKARELLGRSGLQLPRLPSLNTSRNKILTEKNLQGYLKNNPALSVSHSGNTFDGTSERLAQLRQQVQQAVGAANMRHIDIVSRADLVRPDNAEALRGAEGFYDPTTRRVTLIAEALPNARTAQFVAWHELGHRKIDVSGWQQWRDVLAQSRLNPTIRDLAQIIGHRRKAAGEHMTLDIATEEAAVELYAAMKNGDYDAISEKYGVTVPQAMRAGLGGYFARFAQRLKAVLAKAFGGKAQDFSDAQVFGLLRGIDRAQEVSGNLNDGETKFSLNEDEGLKFSRSAGGMREKPGWLDRNELGEWEKGLAAYNKLGALVKPVLAKVKLANTHPDSFTRYMRDYRAQVSVAQQTARDIAGRGIKMSESERRLLSDVLELELPPGVETSPEIQELAAAMRTILNQQTDELKALGMISADSAERFRDTYLPRMYSKQLGGVFDRSDLGKMNREFRRAMRGTLGKSINGQHLKGRGIFKEVNRGEQAKYEAQGFELREDYGSQGDNAGKVLMWRDYTREERARMGEERDAVYRFTVGYTKTQADIAKGLLFQRIATDGELASKTEVTGWKQVPNDTIAGTGGVKRYGALAGMWVHPDVAYHLQQQFYMDSLAKRVWREILGWWKLGKTVYNLVAHVNNLMSNMAMFSMAGGRWRDLWPAAGSIYRKDALYREALAHGLVGDAVDVAGLQEMFVGLNNASDDGVIMNTLFGRVLKRADKYTGRVVSRTGKVMQAAYRVEDEVFKLALYRTARQKGLSPVEARDYALTFMFDYSEVPQGIKFLRDTGLLPFVSYTYKAVPALARIALTRPHRMLALVGLMYGINALSYALMGDEADEEEEREYMPDYQKGDTVFGTPKLIRLPWNDSKGKPVFLDVYRWLPLGDFADTQNQMGGLPIPQWMVPNGPIISHYSALVENQDTFTGRDLTKDYMSTGENAVIYGKWLAGQWLPASVGVPLSYHSNNVLDGLKNQFEGTAFAEVLEDMGYTGTNYRGEDKQLYRALLGSVGVKLRGERTEDLKAARQRHIGSQIREVNASIRQTMRDNTLTDAARESKLASRRQYLQRLFEQMPEREVTD